MSLKAKIEAVIYVAEEPVTLAQLAAIFGAEALPENTATIAGTEESAEALIETGFIEAFRSPDDEELTVAALRGAQPEQPGEPSASASESPADLEAAQKRAARQREREVREAIRTIVDELIADYANGDRGMEIREVAGGYRVSTKPEYHDVVRAFVKSLKPPMKLSLQALETLAVIAYKQPVTAPEIGEIRGVDSAGVLGGLIARKLVATAGRKQVIGRPILYKTTKEFLLRFGLRDLNELPSIEEFEKLAGDIEIGEDEAASQVLRLPFEEEQHEEQTMSENVPQTPVEANAGEAGVAVASKDAVEAQSEAPQDTVTPATMSLDADTPEGFGTESIIVTPAAHPAVPLPDDSDGKSQVHHEEAAAIGGSH